MMYINISGYTPTATSWLNRASQLTQELLSATSEELRRRIITEPENRKIWSELKNEFPYYDKCWFSEAKDSVSPYTIEHFRPTLAVSRTDFKKMKLPTFVEMQRPDWTKERKYRSEGYWWLAFEFTNFRICGSLINSKKGNRFPLQSESRLIVVGSSNSPLEIPILLDPTKEDDPQLLTFESDGKAKPTEVDETKFGFLRARISIEIYGLNAIPPLVEHRQRKWKSCLKLIKNNNIFYQRIKPVLESTLPLPDNLVEDLGLFNENCDELKEYMNPHSEFSSVAKTCILSYANSCEWIKDYVLS